MSNVHNIKSDIPNYTQNRYLVTITIINSGKSKLLTVKSIKIITEYGLRDCVRMIENLPQIIKKFYNQDEINEVRRMLEETGCEFIIDDIESIRNRKLIELDIINTDDIFNELIEQDINEILFYNNDIDKIKELLKSRYSNIPEDKIKEILIKPKYESYL